LQVLPVVGLRAVEERKQISVPKPENVAAASPMTAAGQTSADSDVVIVVPAREEGSKAVLSGQNRWRVIRISDVKLQQIRYIAAYQSKPAGAVTHYAEVATIEPYGEGGKYQLIFAGRAIPIGPVPFGAAPIGQMLSARYTTLAKLKAAKTIMDLF
jgi:hypothetical protein